VPAASGGRAYGTSDEGRRVRDLLAHYRRAGVPLAELGEVIGVSGARVSSIVRSGGQSGVK